jgi:hypothetical protein
MALLRILATLVGGVAPTHQDCESSVDSGRIKSDKSGEAVVFRITVAVVGWSEVMTDISGISPTGG